MKHYFLIFLIISSLFAKNVQSLDPQTIYKNIKQEIKQRNFKNTIKLIDEYLQSPNVSKNDTLSANLHYTKAKVYKYKGRFDIAIEHFKKSLTLAEDKYSKTKLLKIYLKLGYSLYHIANYDQALVVLFKGLKILEDNPNNNMKHSYLCEIGHLFFHSENYNKALTYYRNALDIAREINKENVIAYTFCNIASTYAHLDKHEESEYFFKEAIKIDKKLNNQYALSSDYNNLAITYAAQKNNNMALKYFKLSYEIDKANNDTINMIQAEINLAVTYFKRNNIDKARIYLKKITDKSQIYENNKNIHSKLLLLKSQIAFYDRDISKGFKIFNKYHKISHNINNQSIKEKLLQKEYRFQLERREKEIESLQKDCQIQSLNIQKERNTKTYYFSIVILISVISFIILFLYRKLLISQKKTLQEIQIVENLSSKLKNQFSENKTKLNQAEERLARYEKISEVTTIMSSLVHEVKNCIQIIHNGSEIITINIEEIESLHHKILDDHKIKKNEKENLSYAIKEINDSLDYQQRSFDILYRLFETSLKLNHQDKSNTKNNINQIIEDVYRFKRRKVENITIAKKLKENIPPLKIIYQELFVIVINLFNNALEALKYTPDACIIISTYLDEKDSVVLSITDNGKGIDPNHIDKIFQPYFSTKKDNNSFGLGLYIVKKILHSNGASIDVSSKPGETTFIIKFNK